MKNPSSLLKIQSRNILFLGLTILACSASAQDKMSDFGVSFSTAVTYDSNINIRAGGNDDVYVTGTVGADYSRRIGRQRLGVNGQVSHEEYIELTEHNDTSFTFGIIFDPSIDRQDADFTYDLDLILSRDNVEDEAAGGRVNTTNTGAKGSIRYSPNRRWSASTQASYRKTSTDGESLLDRDKYGGGAAFHYHYSPRLSAITAIDSSFTKADQLGEEDYWTHTLSVGLSGRIRPKLSGSASVGAQLTTGGIQSSEWTPYASLALNYSYNSLTSFSLSVSRSIVDTSIDISTEATSVNLTATRQLRKDLSGSFFTSYTVQDLDSSFTGPREDEIYAIGAGLAYQVAGWGSLALDIRHQEKQSNASAFSYDKLVATARLSWDW